MHGSVSQSACVGCGKEEWREYAARAAESRVYGQVIVDHRAITGAWKTCGMPRWFRGFRDYNATGADAVNVATARVDSKGGRLTTWAWSRRMLAEGAGTGWRGFT